MISKLRAFYAYFLRLSNRGKATFVIFALILFYLFYTEVYTPTIRYMDFGIRIPSGYSIHGIDVSHHQGRIDWDEVADMRSQGMKLDFAFIKATEGVSLRDNRFKQNWKDIKKTGMTRGAYHFFRANRNGRAQARFFLSRVDFEDGDLYPVIDVESLDGQSPATLKSRVLDFLNYVEEETGVKAIIYTNLDYKKNYLSGEEFDDYPLWIAHYNNYNEPRIDEWDFWQHSESGHVNSIRPEVDFNVFDGGSRRFRKLCFSED